MRRSLSELSGELQNADVIFLFERSLPEAVLLKVVMLAQADGPADEYEAETKQS
jgi:hypothetical protein